MTCAGCFLLTTLPAFLVIFGSAALAQSGDIVISGTRVHGVVDQDRGIATFSNACGTQTLTQRELQAGAIPDRLVPCPRPNGNSGASSSGASSAADAVRRQEALCVEKHNEAKQANDRGIALKAKGDLEGAIAHFERAATLLQTCKDRESDSLLKIAMNTGFTQADLEYRRRAEQEREGLRVAKTSPGNIYSGPNPFTSTQPNDQSRLRLAPNIISSEARKSCGARQLSFIDLQTCMGEEETKLIFQADPQIKFLCESFGNSSARTACALKAYASRYLDMSGADTQDCYYKLTREPCYPSQGSRPPSTRKDSAENLREQLRKRLAAAKGGDGTVTEEEITEAIKKREKEGQPSSADLTDNKVVETDDPLKHYLAGDNRGSSGTNAGNLEVIAPHPAESSIGAIYKERFGIDLSVPKQSIDQQEETLFDRTHKTIQNQEKSGQVGR